MQILDEFIKRKFVYIILTNGTMITEDVAKELAQKNPFEVHVSILGLEDEHDYISGMQGAFKKTISAIRYMRKEGITVVAKVIGTQYNMNVLDEMESIAKAEADRYVMTTNLFPPVDGLPSPDEVSICHSDLVELIKNKSSFTGKPKAPDDSAPVCMAGQCVAAISPYGEFFPCVVFRKEIGHVLREKINHIWKSPDMMEIANLKWKDLYKCKGCEEKALCTYCPGKSWLVHGDMCRATEDTCNYTKKVATLWADSDR
jgi:radical SAM protein with 4Fe4S-binding SPASM domain